MESILNTTPPVTVTHMSLPTQLHVSTQPVDGCVCSSSHSALYSPTCDTVFILSKLQQRCIVERQIPILSYQPSKFFN